MQTTTGATTMTTHTPIATSASAEFARLLAEAIAIATRTAGELADGEAPKGPDWGHGGDQAPPRELGEVPAVVLVGLGREGCQALHLHGITDGHVPTAQLELVVDEAGPGHRLDDRAHLVAVPKHTGRERTERISGRGD